MKKIAIGSDRAGYLYKEMLCQRLGAHYVVEDFGPSEQVVKDEVDYPDYAHRVAFSVQRGACEMGILLCGSGNGVNMVANRYPKVRAALCWRVALALLARQHNNANILSLPARFMSEEEAYKTAETFLREPFDTQTPRHVRRVQKILQVVA